MSSTNTCQVSACTNSQFTYCPHCSLHICMNCLNQHYLIMENEYKQDLLDFQTELNMNRQQSIYYQKHITRQLSKNQFMQYDQFEKFLSNKIDQNGKPTMRNFQLFDYLEIKQNYALLIENHQKFDQLLNQINQLIVDFQGNTDLSNQIEAAHSPASSELNTGGTASMIKDEPVLVIESDDECSTEASSTGNLELFMEDRMSHVTHTSNIAIQPINHNQNQPLSITRVPQTAYTMKQLRRMFAFCPFTKYKFGLQNHHCCSNGITNIPCESSVHKKTRLFNHLQQHHVFNSSATLKIIRTLISLSDHLDQIDLFSNEPLDAILGNIIVSYTDHCPLSRKGIYGISPEHQVKSCNKNRRKKIFLYGHMQTIHRISDPYATRLVRAMINNIDENTPIIQPHEKIVRD